ncbi:MAG: DUF4157 domain-containing protein [Gemmatimonadota bacterium]
MYELRSTEAPRARAKPTQAPAPAVRAPGEAGPLWSALALRAQSRRSAGDAAGDPLEREADRVADAVGGDAAPVGGETAAAPVAPATGPGGGEPLPPDERAVFEPRFGADFGGVRIHRDAAADRAAELIGASAFTVGDRIAFRAGRYDARSPAGRRLLAHELTHVVQQRGGGAGRAAGPISGAPVGVARKAPPESRASVHQRVLKGMIELVKLHPSDDLSRQEGLVRLFETVPEDQVAGLYHRLEPGARTDDFAQYFKDKYAFSRAEGLLVLRNRMPAPAKAATGAKSSPEVPGKAIGQEIAAACGSLPSKDTGAPLIGFGLALSGSGYTMNPKYWTVRYTLVKGDARRTFTATPDTGSGWEQAAAFLERNEAEWKDAFVDVHMEVGRYGAAAAIEDVYDPVSASLYSLDCLAMATLVQLRGIYMSYPEATRDADFDRDYGSFSMDRFGDDAKLPTSSLEKDVEVVTLPAPVRLKDYASIGLQPGDQVPITNPFIPSGAWMTENTVYAGDGKFFGHPFGVVTVEGYATKLSQEQLNRNTPLEERVKFVLEHSVIASYSRPRTRAAREAK